MRKLDYEINIEHFQKIKADLVPILFTEHQFKLIKKKFTHKSMTQSEKNEFSRTISKKMKAINKIQEKETNNVFIYGKEKIIEKRLKIAKSDLKKFSRKFKNKHIFISGSFLYKEKYKDIDIFVITKYEKEDYKEGEFHINYLTEDVYSSLFFASIRKLSVSNKIMEIKKIEEKINIDTFISIYQELFNDLDKKHPASKFTLREFLIQAAFISKSPLPDSQELKQQLDSIKKNQNPKEIVKKIFVNSILLGTNPKKSVKEMKEMIDSYQNVIKEYKQHKNYYQDLIQAFEEVIAVAG